MTESLARHGTPVPPTVGRSRARTAVVVACLGFFLITLDMLIVNVALSRIGDELGGGTAALQWVVDSYTLAFAALLMCAGNLSDRLGANRAFTIGVAAFAVTSAVCAIAPSVATLVGARAAQGAAAALLLPASMALLQEAHPEPARRARALGIWTAGGAVASAVGPLLGGALTTVQWRLVFAVNIPVCLFVLVRARYLAPSPRRPSPFDVRGQILVILSLVALIYGLIEGGVVGFGSPVVLVALAIGLISGVVFVLTQARADHPLLPLQMLRPRAMRIALLLGFAFMSAWFGTVFVASLYLQQEAGLSPLVAGLVFVPPAIISLGGNLASGPLTNRFGPRVPAVAGAVGMTLGLVAMVGIVPLRAPALVSIVVMLVGLGGSLMTPAATGLVLQSAGVDRSGIASAIFNTFRQVGGAVTIAVSGALVAGLASFSLGAQVTFGLLAVVSMTAVIAAFGIPRLGSVPVGPA